MKALSLLIVTVTCLFNPSAALRTFKQRSDLRDVPPISASDWTVPLEGGLTCENGSNCTDSLPEPPRNKVLKILALARGVFTYSCVGVDPMLRPEFVSQVTTLLDAAPLVPYIATEDDLQKLVAKLYDYDYTGLLNSTLTCIGTIYTEEEEEIVNLDNTDAFPVHVEEAIEPLETPAFNALWAHSVSVDGAWDVYRVETVGGAAPAHCDGQNDTITLGYAAEYWFYHA